MHDFAERLTVTGLFGYVRHEIDFRVEDQITILTGVNGSGKTHVLNILRSLVGFDLMSLTKVPVTTAAVDYVSGKTLSVEQVDPGVIQMRGGTAARDLGDLVLRVLPDSLEEVVPPFIERVDDDYWIDRTDGEIISTGALAARYGVRHRGRVTPGMEVVGEPRHDLSEWQSLFRPSSAPTLVETQRLDTRIAPDPRRGPGRRASVSRIRQYVDQVAEQISDARRASLEVSQRADRQFATRALDKARATVKESELRKNYQSLAELNQELNMNGLTEASMGVEFPGGRTNPTERRILSVFLEDWAAKLEALESVHRKLQILRGVVGDKLVGKSMIVEAGELNFVNKTTAEPVRVERLSSGEQHLLALFTMLIFAADVGGLVLIDEPEIESAWVLWRLRNLEVRNGAWPAWQRVERGGSRRSTRTSYVSARSAWCSRSGSRRARSTV